MKTFFELKLFSGFSTCLIFLSFITQILAEVPCTAFKCVKCDVGSWSMGYTGCNLCTNSYTLKCEPFTGFASLCSTGYGLSVSATAGSCTLCPEMAWSDGTFPCKSCRTPSGFTFACDPKTGIATNCDPGFGFISSVCLACTAGNFSPGGPSSVAVCSACSVGKFSLPSAVTCAQCPINTFAASTGTANSCSICPSGSTSPVGSTLQSQCVTCNLAGNYINSSGYCVPCGTGVATCNANPLTCLSGYGWDGTQCNQCQAGSFSTGVNNNCAQCLINTFSISNGLSSCSACSSGQTSPLGSSLASACVTCNLAGNYINSSGYCVPCGTGVATCNANPLSCLSGYGWDGTRCNQCQAGSFSTGVNNNCAQCLINTFSISNGLSSCNACTSGSTSPIGSSLASQCIACPAGSFINTAGACVDCGVGITLCSSSGVASTCDAGYGWNGSVCTACTAGKSSPGVNAVCSACLTGTFALAVSGSCTTCSDLYQLSCSQSTGASLTCVTNYAISGQVCVASIFARYVARQVSTIGSSLASVTTEKACAQTCAPAAAIWLSDSNTCSCGSADPNTAFASMVSYTAGASMILGPCIPGSTQQCQTVTYNQNGCIGIDGTTACTLSSTTNCQDNHAKVCTLSNLGLTITCNINYNLVNGICQPYLFARFAPATIYCPSTSNYNGPFTALSELLCMQTCVALNPINGRRWFSRSTSQVFLSAIFFFFFDIFYPFYNPSPPTPPPPTALIGIEYMPVGRPNQFNPNSCWCLYPGCQSAAYGTGGSVDKVAASIVSFIGNCATSYPIMNSNGFSCVTAFYSATTGCRNSISGSTCAVPTSTNCVDKNALTCDSINLAVPLTCVTNYSLINQACQITNFARFGGTKVVYSAGTISTNAAITTELACNTYCITNNAQNGPFQGWILSAGCTCFGNAAVASVQTTNTLVGTAITVLVGSCSMYTTSMSTMGPCSNVNYNSLGCITTTGGACCTDNYAATCNSLGAALTCQSYFSLSSGGICIPQVFSRINQGINPYNLIGSQYHTVNQPNEAACVNSCTALSTMNGPLQGITYTYNTGSCDCKTGSNAFYLGYVSGMYASLMLGSCSTYVAQLPVLITCQTVTFASGSCLGIDGAACKCYDVNSLTCTPDGVKPLTCNKYYAVVNNICQPAQFARYRGFDAPGQDIAYYPNYYSEESCYVTCISNNPVSGPMTGFVRGTDNNYCWCKYLPVATVWQGFVTSGSRNLDMVGTCASYSGHISAPCTDVIYTPSGGCSTPSGGGC